ncbi:MAG: helix-turn-helix domain-containing protein [Oscillospiraceae bacterium]|nr:helix-turn-helix domain-containing protein [Oscillospiraceae bacterium]
MSSRMFQSVIVQMKDATDRMFGVIDSEGHIVACSEPSAIGEKMDSPVLRLNAALDSVCVAEKKTFKALASWGAYFEFAVFVDGEDELATSLCLMAAVAFNGAKSYYEDKHDKGTFVKNIITDNILPGDVYIRAKELHFITDTPRAVFLVRQIGRADVATVDLLQKLFAEKQQDFVLSINETDIAIVKQVEPGTTNEQLVAMAQSIEETIRTDLLIKTTIGIGTIAGHLRELANVYKEAQVAIEVGKVFDTEKSIIHYENLGIGRLIYQLPTTLCEIFLSEVFKNNSIDALDQETLYTINKFFENNLNVSETSRKLFVHRNTLVYRLEKIKKLTGLDLREFDHAIIFKVALMVKKYLVSREPVRHGKQLPPSSAGGF